MSAARPLRFRRWGISEKPAQKPRLARSCALRARRKRCFLLKHYQTPRFQSFVSHSHKGKRQAASDQKRAEENALRFERAEAAYALARMVAHDINNINHAINLCGDMVNDLLRYIASGEPANRIIDDLADIRRTLRKSHNRIASLSKQLQGTDTYAVLKRSRISINDIVESSMLVIPDQVHLVCHFPKRLWHVYVDNDRITRVFENLFSNAVNAIQENGRRGRIVVRAKNLVRPDRASIRPAQSRFVKISVSDNGPGIPENALTRIFNWSVSTRKKTGGSGMGLWISRNAVYEHDGEMTVESREGAGTTFHVLLPAYEEKERRKEELNAMIADYCRLR